MSLSSILATMDAPDFGARTFLASGLRMAVALIDEDPDVRALTMLCADIGNAAAVRTRVAQWAAVPPKDEMSHPHDIAMMGALHALRGTPFGIESAYTALGAHNAMWACAYARALLAKGLLR